MRRIHKEILREMFQPKQNSMELIEKTDIKTDNGQKVYKVTDGEGECLFTTREMKKLFEQFKLISGK